MKREIKISKEASLEIILEWCDFFSEPLDKQTIEDSSLIKAVMEGRVDFDEEAEQFRLTLRKPIALENKDSIGVLTLTDPGSAYALDKQKVISKGKGVEMDIDTVSAKMVSATDQPLGVLRRLSMHDYNTLDEMLGFFR